MSKKFTPKDSNFETIEDIFSEENDKPADIPAAEAEPAPVFEETDSSTPGKENDFEASLKSLRSDDIKQTCTAKPRSVVDGVFFVRMTILVVCSSVFLFSVYTMAKKIIDDMRTDSLLSGIVDSVDVKSEVARSALTKYSPSTLTLFDRLGTDGIASDFDEIDETGEYDTIRYKLQELKSDNNDIYGWIRVSGGISIEYPVVKGSDNDVYLYRDINGNYAKAGSIFVDYRNSKTHSNNYNTVFYGHCMTNGTMFRPIHDWFRSSDYRALANTIKIEIITLDAAYVYEIFSAYRSEGSSFVTTSFSDENAYYQFLKTIYGRSIMGKKASFDVNSRIITLSTCTNVASKPDERYVVHAILTKTVKYN